MRSSTRSRFVSTALLGIVGIGIVGTGCATGTRFDSANAPISGAIERTTYDRPNIDRSSAMRWTCEIVARGTRFTAVGATITESENRVRSSCAERFDPTSCADPSCRTGM